MNREGITLSRLVVEDITIKGVLGSRDMAIVGTTKVVKVEADTVKIGGDITKVADMV